MKQLLFLCTGNYYRSRYAEILFNWRAEQDRLTWRAASRALNPDPANYGPLSRHTMAALRELEIPFEAYLRMPIMAVEADFRAADHVIAVKEAEHRPLMERKFPAWTERVEFWHVHDVDCADPSDALPQLHQLVLQLVDRLASGPRS